MVSKGGTPGRHVRFVGAGSRLKFGPMNILRNIAAFLAAFVVGSITMFALHELHMTIWPEETMPPVDSTTEEFRAWMATLSMTTMLAATLVHWIGTAAGVATGTMIAVRSRRTGRRSMWPAYVMGVWFFLGGIANAIQLGTPIWLTVTDALGYLPVAYATGKWMTRA